ncbi:MAG: MarR family winged helix-turn-helix transcriptional regulator [Butyrivibrio sp.]|nr:MarR family winged helix-turn-helix transcriptional regulator [Butyrivibrio sp.]
MLNRFDMFTTSVTQIYKSLQRIKNREMTEFNLKGTHTMCIFRLGRNPEGMTLTALSAACEEDKAAMSRTVAELTRDGYVTVGGAHKYRAPITLTDKGRLVAARVNEMVAEAVAAGGGGLTEEERLNFYHALELISENLKNYLKEDSH